ncbi:probable 3',5'-cyclic phosphodiesterase pde-5 isoform X1 [Ostrinia nubilalis]|uniref:probable 3',5'-cyclic phosphodiesterase pde-5 isoform X1 n=2 Tax=Ostrinia nubilalis TaxID=29057 RepID=UPI0030826B6E
MQSSRNRAPGYRSPRLLPPIPNGSGESSSEAYLKPCLGEQKMWSKYHSGCVDKSPTRFDCVPGKSQKKKTPSLIADRITRRFKFIRDADSREVLNYLDRNRDFLETYVLESVPIEEMERWFFRKIKQNFIDDDTPRYESRTKMNHKSASTMPTFVSLVKDLQNELSEHTVLWELAKTIALSVGVDAYIIYKLYPDHPTFVQCFVADDKSNTSTLTLDRVDLDQVTLVLEAAKKMTSLRVSRHEDPARFPKTPRAIFETLKDMDTSIEANHILYQPILISNGKTGYVIEMWRVHDRFREPDEQVSSSFMLWGSLALHYCNMYLDKKRERNMSDFLLDVVKAIFEEMVSLDQLIKRILEFAQRLVNADRASLFLVDYRNFELVSTVFDLKFEPGHERDLEKKEIRMPINRGIAGHVALSGETMNIPDAYSDYRFNREVDEATGYKTISILCMPIKVEGKVIGVVQMVNKRNEDNFDREDEVSFEIFSSFFGLALHHARLYDRIMRKEQKYRVALEVLSYHNTCREYEVQRMLENSEDIEVKLNDFALDPYKLNEYQKCRCVIKMFDDLFELSKFDLLTLTRFVLTVKKNYRTVPYHNFDHGWSVAHAMYVILKNDKEQRFDYIRRLALFVSSLCHDLDHRGYTNKYMSETASPLAAMYTTSTLEHHHFNITVTILQQDGHNIFAHISSEEYKEILGYIRQAILATDLAAFFPNLEKIKELHNDSSTQKFNWEVSSHIDLAMAISMTAADLSASAKPWEVQIKTVKVIFEEFYDQGDKERAIGKTPIPMMDRNKPEEQPASQVGFLSQICIPCYAMLHKILPNTVAMYKMANKNLERWKFRAERILNSIESDSIEHFDDDDDDHLLQTVDEIGDDDIKHIVKTDEEETKSLVDVTLVDKDVEEIIRKPPLENSQSVDTFSWEEEESIKNAITENTVFWRDGDGVAWIDEEGVVVKSNALKGVVTNVCESEVNSTKL